MQMKKNITIIAIIVAAIAVGAIGYYIYAQSQKSELEKAAEKTNDFGKEVVKDTKKLFN